MRIAIRVERCTSAMVRGLLFAALSAAIFAAAPLGAQDSQSSENDRSPQAASENAQPSAQPPPHDAKEEVNVDDHTRNFLVHLPQSYDSHQHYPVVILLHGSNQSAEDMERLTHFNQLADKNGVIAIYPNAVRGEWNIGVRPDQPADMGQRRPYGRRGGWGGGGYPGGGGGYPGGGGGNYPGGQGGGQNGGQNGGQGRDENRNRNEPLDDVAFLNQSLDQLALKYSIDTRRIYATGLGDGGFMAQRMGCSMADRVAAIAPVAADFPKTMICLPSRPVPALFLDGTEDPVIPFNGGTYKPGRFHVLSAEDSAKTWATFDRCAEKPKQDKIPAPQKGAKETKTYTYNSCHDNAQVSLYAIKDGGATWPGGEQYMSEKEVGKVSNALDANETIWNFLTTKKLAGESGGGK